MTRSIERSPVCLRVTDGDCAGSRRSIGHGAWEVSAARARTGEGARLRGVTRPNQAFTSDGAGWDAFERVARHAGLDIDEVMLPWFAEVSAAASVSSASTLRICR